MAASIPWIEIREGTDSRSLAALGPAGLGAASYQGHEIPLVIIVVPEGDPYYEEPTVDCVGTFDLVSVFPFPAPLLAALFVLFPSRLEPVWTIKPVPATALYRDTDLDRGRYLFNALAVMDSGLPLHFCNPLGLCGLVVIDSRDTIVLKRLTQLETPHTLLGENSQRIGEIRAALGFLANRNASLPLSTFLAAAATLVNEYCGLIQRPSGFRDVVPAGRNFISSRETIFSLVLDSSRLIRREHVEERDRGRFGLRLHDVFISYAHIDHEPAMQIAKTLRSLWPSLRVFITDPKDMQAFENDPMYFLTASRQARAVVFLATPNSLSRPMTHTEIGLNAEKPIFALIHGWPDRVAFDEWLAGNLYVHVPGENVFVISDDSDYGLFIHRLGAALGLGPPAGPNKRAGQLPDLEDQRITYDVGEKYAEDFRRMDRAEKSSQTEEEARKLMAHWFATRTFASAEAREYILSQNAYIQLLCILETLRSTDSRETILAMFPGLMNEKMLKALYARARSGGYAAWVPEVAEMVQRRIGRRE